MKSLTFFWRKISFLGIGEVELEVQEFKTRVFFNRSLAILGLLSIPQVIGANSLIPNIGYFHLIWGVTCYICLFLVAKNHYYLAKNLILVVVVVSGSVVSIGIGPDTISHLGLLGVLIYGIIIFRKNLNYYLLVAIPIISLSIVLTEMNLYDNHFLDHPEIKSARYGVLFTQIIIISIMMTFIVRLNQDQEKLLEEKNILLAEDVSEREVLLTEIHHRVKNNLQVIKSLMNLQAGKAKSQETKEFLEKSQEQIRSISLIHEKLYSSSSFSEIDFGSYLEKLAEDYEAVNDLSRRNIKLKIDVKDIILDLNKSAPCAILMNELITNSIKYAFDTKGGLIEVLGRKENNNFILEVKDNGIGLPDDVEKRIKASVGLQLSKGLAKQIGGELEIINNNGAHFILKFKSN